MYHTCKNGKKTDYNPRHSPCLFVSFSHSNFTPCDIFDMILRSLFKSHFLISITSRSSSSLFISINHYSLGMAAEYLLCAVLSHYVADILFRFDKLHVQYFLVQLCSQVIVFQMNVLCSGSHLLASHKEYGPIIVPIDCCSVSCAHSDNATYSDRVSILSSVGVAWCWLFLHNLVGVLFIGHDSLFFSFVVSRHRISSGVG